MRHLLYCTILLCALPCPTLTKASDFCSNAKQISEDTENRFVNLRGDFDFKKRKYIGNLALDPLTTCFTEYHGKFANYECHTLFNSDSEEDINQTVQSISSELKECFAADISETRLSAGDRAFSIRSAVADLSLISGRISSGQRYIQLEFSTVL